MAKATQCNSQGVVRERVEWKEVFVKSLCVIFNWNLSKNFSPYSSNLSFLSYVFRIYKTGYWKIWFFKRLLAWNKTYFEMSPVAWWRVWPVRIIILSIWKFLRNHFRWYHRWFQRWKFCKYFENQGLEFYLFQTLFLDLAHFCS